MDSRPVEATWTSGGVTFLLTRRLGGWDVVGPGDWFGWLPEGQSGVVEVDGVEQAPYLSTRPKN